MEDVVSVCDEKIKETNSKINQTEGIINQELEKNEHKKIQKAIKSNEASSKISYINENSNKNNDC